MFRTLRFLNLSASPLRRLSYESDISLSKLYPKSKVNIFTPPTAPVSNTSKFNGYVPINMLEITYSSSSGPGGQNVNKLETKCDLRFKVNSVNWLSDETKTKLQQQHRNRITKDGYFVIKSDLTRYRHMNLADALEKLRNFIRDLEREQRPPSEETVEKHKRRQERLSANRVMVKRQRSLTKQQRQELL